MFIQTEATPNPATIKFLPGLTVMEAGSADYKAESDAHDSPLAQRLFKIRGVAGVFLGSDFISVSKKSDADWTMLKPLVLSAVMEHFSTGQPIFTGDANASQAQDNEDLDDISAQIKELIITRVQPMVMQDGGDIAFDRFEDGIVYLHMQGACAGCPSATVTLKSGIENMLKHFVPEVQEVRPTNEF